MANRIEVVLTGDASRLIRALDRAQRQVISTVPWRRFSLTRAELEFKFQMARISRILDAKRRPGEAPVRPGSAE